MQLFHTSFEIILFSSVVLLWALSEYIGGGIIPWLRRKGGEIKKKDDGSVLLLRVMMFVSVLIAYIMVINNIAILPDWLLYPGIVLMIIGILVRQWSILTLGRYFTLTVSVQENQKVVDHGPYRYIRHPSYLGLLLIVTGMGIALHSWGAILVILVMNILSFGYRILVEEKVLITELGDDYVQYMKRTKRLVPFVF